MSATPENQDWSGLSVYERAEKYSKWLESLSLRERVAHLLMPLDYMCPSQKHCDALERLATREAALNAWEKPRSMTVKRDGWCFDSVVSWVARDACFCFLAPAQKRTAAEIKRAGQKAASLAKELAELIEGHSTLQFAGYRISPPDMKNASLGIFSEVTHQGLAYRLRAFADLAAKSAAAAPIVPRPNQASADAHALAVGFCEIFDYAYGGPCIEVTAALVSEAFDTLIDADTVKKWWQRRDVDEGPGDTSEELP